MVRVFLRSPTSVAAPSGGMEVCVACAALYADGCTMLATELQPFPNSRQGLSIEGCRGGYGWGVGGGVAAGIHWQPPLLSTKTSLNGRRAAISSGQLDATREEFTVWMQAA